MVLPNLKIIRVSHWFLKSAATTKIYVRLYFKLTLYSQQILKSFLIKNGAKNRLLQKFGVLRVRLYCTSLAYESNIQICR